VSKPLPLSGDSNRQGRDLRCALHVPENAAPRPGAEREGPRLPLPCGQSSRSNIARLKPIALVAALAAMLIAPAVARADADLSPGLADAAADHPHQVFKVIVQGDPGRRARAVGDDVEETTEAWSGQARGLKRRLVSVDGVSAELTGRQILKLAHKRGILAISVDQPVRITSRPLYTSTQRWPYASGAAKFWAQLFMGFPSSMAHPPAIAVVDSGVDPSVPDLAGRVVHEEDFTSLPDNSPHDGRGHGTFVASVAAGSGGMHAGVAPNADIVSLDVVDDNGMGLTSDVIAAADWILANKDTYDIRVANFSLHGSQPSTFRFDPLDKAVERLWFGGVVVVAASGNYGATQQGVLYAPGNDPFVITVGAVDLNGTIGTADDFAAPWSARGSTLDGFAKPEISAPGRYMVGAIPPGSTLAAERPDRLVEPGYLLMSGTSFATPVVAGTAAYILARHPNFTPDQVKGALMLTARPTPAAVAGSTGVGEVAADRAVEVASPPNPNLALDQFLVDDPDSDGRIFDQATWTTYASNNPAWDAATWTTATWTTATWTTATWTTAAWQASTWESATWTTATWTTATWTTATWTTSNDATWTTSAESESNPTGGEFYDPAEKADAEDSLGITLDP
jgi:serine protease AprX